MYLGILYLSLDLEPEVPSADRERVLRTLRDKMRQFYSHRITIRSDNEQSLVVAFLDDSFSHTKRRIEEITEKVEGCGEARLDFSHSQILCWHDGTFRETSENNLSDLDTRDSTAPFRAKIPTNHTNHFSDVTIKYNDDEEDSKIFSRKNRLNSWKKSLNR